MKEILVSRQNPTVKRICSLTEKKNRRREGLFRFDGMKLLEEAARGGLSLVYVVLRMPMEAKTEERVRTLMEEGVLDESVLLPVSESVFEKMTEEKSPEGILCVAKLPDELHRSLAPEEPEETLCPGEKLLILESVRDPGNLGTVLRSADALGIDRLILTEDCADLYHPRTVRAAMGALFRLPTLTVPTEALPCYIERLRTTGRRLYAAALHTDALTVGEFPLYKGDGLVIGNEGHGLSEAVIAACDRAAVIPMREGAESLNAAAAAAICIWETVRAGKGEGQ